MVEGYVALGLFVALVAFLSYRSVRSRGAAQFMRRRFGQVFWPWLIACLGYLLVDVWRQGAVSRIWTLSDWHWLLVGPEIHLWFLPFLILTMPLVAVVPGLVTGTERLWSLTLVLIPLATAALALHDLTEQVPPFGQWAFAAMPLAYGLLHAAGEEQGTRLPALAFALTVGLIPWLLWGSVTAPFLMAACLLFDAFWRTEVTGRWLPAIGRLALGIYLVHHFVLLAWYATLGAAYPTWVAGIVVFLVSAAMTWAFLTVYDRVAAIAARSGGRPVSTGIPAA